MRLEHSGVLRGNLNGPDELLCVTVPEPTGLGSADTHLTLPVCAQEIEELVGHSLLDPPVGRDPCTGTACRLYCLGLL